MFIFQKSRKQRFALWSAGVLFISVATMMGGDIKHYKTTRSTQDHVVFVDHYEWADQLLSLELSPQWIGLEEAGDALARFRHRSAGCSIEIRMFPLEKMPEDEKEADRLYLSEIQKLPSPNVHKGSHVPAFNMPSAFPRSYSLAATRKDPPKKITTFFVRMPHLYCAIIEFPGQLIAEPRVDYQGMLRSIRIDTQSPPPPEVAEAAQPKDDPTPSESPAAPPAVEREATSDVSISEGENAPPATEKPVPPALSSYRP